MSLKAKSKTIFCCQDCGGQSSQWQGQCPQCRAWNTLVAEVQTSQNARTTHYAGSESRVLSLSDVSLEERQRISTGLSEFDHVLGGGLVSDSVVLLGGDPGIGKSTLLLQVVAALAQSQPALYVTGEELLQQIAARAHRLQCDGTRLQLLAETGVERILGVTQTIKPKILVIDSIQTLYTETVPSAPGSVSQVRESAAQCVRFAKQTGTALFVIGHVTKEGAIAGPRVLEHMVDTVLYFEGQNSSRFRVIRAVKNRFGAVNELGVFAMTDKGLCQVNNPSAIFLSRDPKPTPGSLVLVTWEGSRPLLVEVQALVDESHLANPRRVVVGVDHNRLAMLLAVLNRHCQVPTFNQDVFVNIVGGLRVTETASDLAVLLAVISSLKNQALPPDWVAFGEVGLSGEIRPVQSGTERIREAIKHGFTQLIIPKANAPKQVPAGVTIIAVEKLQDAVSLLRQLA